MQSSALERRALECQALGGGGGARVATTTRFGSSITPPIMGSPLDQASVFLPARSVRMMGAGDDYDFLLGPTFALSLLAALLALVETALLRIFIQGLGVGAGSPAIYRLRFQKMNEFWVTFGLGLVVVVFESVTFANSKIAVDDFGERFRRVNLEAQNIFCRESSLTLLRPRMHRRWG